MTGLNYKKRNHAREILHHMDAARIKMEATHVKENTTTTVSLTVNRAELEFWYEVFDFGFTLIKDDFASYEQKAALQEMAMFDKWICTLEEFKLESTEAGNITITLFELHSLLTVTEMYKNLFGPLGDNDMELYKTAERHESVIQGLSFPYKAELKKLDRVIALEHQWPV
jgi:hypothetical protein